MSKNSTNAIAKNRRTAAALATMVLTVAFLLPALSLLPVTSAPELHMDLLSEGMKEVDYGGSAEYRISIMNTGDENAKPIPLSIADIPEGWEAELSDTYISVPANSREIVTLTVTAPTRSAMFSANANTNKRGDDNDGSSSDNDGGSASIDRIASIGIRGGNVTVGTVTVLKGTLDLERNGQTTELDTDDDDYEVISGDLLTSHGFAMVDIDLAALFSGNDSYTGDIFVGLNNATVGFMRTNDTGFMWVKSGDVVVMSSEGGGGVRGDSEADHKSETQSGTCGGTRADDELSGWMFEIGPNADLDNAIPNLDYRAVLSFEAGADDILMTMSLDESSDDAKVDVHEGSLIVSNEQSNIFLEDMESITGTAGAALPIDTNKVRSIVVETDSGGSTSELITIDGVNILERDNVHLLVDAYGRDYYFSWFPDDGALPEIRVTHEGSDTGGGTGSSGTYHTSITTIDTNSSQTFEMTPNATVITKDVITVTGGSLKIESNEDKTYDLSIRYHDDEMTQEESFTLNDVETSDEEQVVTVNDWTDLDNTESSPVTFTEDGVTVTADNHDDGPILKDKMNQKNDDGENEDFPVLWLCIILFVLLGGGAAVIFMFGDSIFDKSSTEIKQISTDSEIPEEDQEEQIEPASPSQHDLSE